jgi:hypothetical protein
MPPEGRPGSRGVPCPRHRSTVGVVLLRVTPTAIPAWEPRGRRERREAVFKANLTTLINDAQADQKVSKSILCPPQ